MEKFQFFFLSKFFDSLSDRSAVSHLLGCHKQQLHSSVDPSFHKTGMVSESECECTLKSFSQEDY